MTGNSAPWERLAGWESIPGLRHGFVTRVPGLEVGGLDKVQALERLGPFHERALEAMGMAGWPVISAPQVHGGEVAVLARRGEGEEVIPLVADLAGVDGFVTDRVRVALAVYVADCAAVYLVDAVRRVAGLVHSGKKGTELEIARRAIDLMEEAFGSKAGDLAVVISPCIRPPLYEVDFAAVIRDQCLAAGVPEASIRDEEECTGSDLDRFYSYRMERGQTGRMMAVLGWEG